MMMLEPMVVIWSSLKVDFWAMCDNDVLIGGLWWMIGGLLIM